MKDVSLLRLYLLRVLYALIAFAMGAQIWPLLFNHRPWDDIMHGVAVSFLAALSALCLLGLRYPLRMLPLLIYELAWKTVWLIAFALPAWRAGPVSPAMLENTISIGLVVILPFILPWGYIWSHYVRAPGDRWGRA